MARKFAEITFTDSVKEVQTAQGSRKRYARFEEGIVEKDIITDFEKEFIEERDGFYQATSNADGWPYVQFRGGPKGFLKVIDHETLGYADFRGNIQYISVGNLKENDRVAMILMDYPQRRRLKVWARASLVDVKDDPSLIQKLAVPDYHGKIERAVILKVEALDWNCPQHITPRFSADEIQEAVQPLHQRIAELEEALKEKELSKV